MGDFPKNVGDFLKNVGVFWRNVGDFLLSPPSSLDEEWGSVAFSPE